MHTGHRPDVAVGDLEFGVVAPGDDAVTGPDACRASGGSASVVDPSGPDELGAHRAIERGDLLVGVRHHDNPAAVLVGVGGLPGERCDPLGVAAMNAYLAAVEQRIEHLGRVVGGAHRQADSREFLVRNNRPVPVWSGDGAGEAMHRVQFPVRVWVYVAGG